MKRLAFLLFVIPFKVFSQDCPTHFREIYRTIDNEGIELTTCWDGLSFQLGVAGKSWQSFPVLVLEGKLTVLDALKTMVGNEKLREEFLPIYDRALNEYASGLNTRITKTLVSDQVETIALLNNQLMGIDSPCPIISNLFPYSLDLLEGKSSQVKCNIRISSLSPDFIKSIDPLQLGTGQRTLERVIQENPDAEFTLRSRVSFDQEGRPRTISGDERIPLSDFLHFDLIITTKKGQSLAIGHCLDQKEVLLGLDSQSNSEDNQVIYEDESEVPFSAKLVGNWRMPFSVDMGSDYTLNKNGERVKSFDLGLNTGLLYQKEFNGGGSLTISPKIGIPILDDFNSGSQILKGEGFGNAIPNSITLSIQIKM